jgi:hypothetical protein
MEAATTEVINNDRAVRGVAKEYEIFHVSLHTSCAELSKNESPKTGYRPHNRAFDSQQEEVLKDYVKRVADL